jgi:hypothetical protein
MALTLLVAGCATAPATMAPARPAPPTAAAASAIAVAPHVSVRAGAPEGASDDALAPFRRIASNGGLIGSFAEDVERTETGYNLLVVPADSQAKADEVARAWAPDARPIFAGYGFWKKAWISFVRHGYYSRTKDRALMLDFAISKRVLVRKTDEPGGAYGDAATVLDDAADQYTYGAKLATDIAKAHGYTPKKIHVAAIMNLRLYGPHWVFLDDRDWTPTLMVNAKTGQVTRTGPMIEAVKLLMKPAQPASPGPAPSPTASPVAGGSPSPSPTPSSLLPF